MKHEVSTLHTKKALAVSLKRFMEKKPLSKITVSEIITDCGVNRKTFYYHFQDIYALLKWMLEAEAVEVVKQFDLLVDHEDAILFVMDYVEANRHILNCAYDSMGREEMKRFFYADFIGITRGIIDRTETLLNVRTDESFKDFLASFYTEALAGLLIQCFKDRIPPDREQTIQDIALIFRASLPSILLEKAGVGAAPHQPDRMPGGLPQTTIP